MARQLRLAAAWRSLFILLLIAVAARAETIVLKNGMRLEGTLGTLSGLKGGALGPFGGGGAAGADIKSIVIVDDSLRRTLVPSLQVSSVPEAGKSTTVKIPVPQRVYHAGLKVGWA